MATSHTVRDNVVRFTPICNAEIFLRELRRDAGVLCTLDKDGNWRQHPFADPDAALALVESYKATHDVYVTMGTLRDGARQRTAEDIASLCGFFVDLDCHGKEGEYKTTEEASTALKRFCKATGVPSPDYLVSSGHGLHAHWTFTDPLPRETWQEVANKFKALTEAYGLKADPTVTADPARVLRVPCTNNFRDRAAPVEVELLPIPSIAEPTTLQEFQGAVDKALATWRPERSGSTRRPLSPLMTLVRSVQEELSDTPENVELVRRMLDCLDPDCDYHAWRNAVWAVASTGFAAAPDLASGWSKKGKDWDPEAFDRVWHSYDPHREAPIGFGTLVRQARDAGYDGGVPIARSAGASVVSQSQVRFRLLDRAAIMALPPLRWRVKGLLPETGIAAIYGPSKSGKSFLSFDLGCAIARGAKWFGHRTVMGPVTYVMLEGETALRNRAAAWEQQNAEQLPAGFQAMNLPFQIFDLQQVKELGAILPQGGVTIIDTLNRAAPGLDENSSQDMGRILAGMKSLQEITGGLVLVVHHPGKDASKGLRGHSSLLAALDGAIEVERTATSRSWSAAKVKDGEDGKQVAFKLDFIDLGTDGDGDPITSCAVSSDAGAIFQLPPPSGANQKAALAAIRKALSASSTLGRAGCDPQTQCMKLDDAVAVAAASLVGVEKKRRGPRAREAMQGLIEGKHLRRGLDAEQEEWVWL